MPHVIDKKIVAQRVMTEEEREKFLKNSDPPLEVLDLDYSRPEVLDGKTYKLNLPDHNLYLTINNVTLNKGTRFETVVPYEVFIQGGGGEHYEWITALCRLSSAVFRASNDPTLVSKNFKKVFDSSGGFYANKTRYKSTVAYIGAIIEKHIESLSIKEEPLEVESLPSGKVFTEEQKQNATICNKCGDKAVINTGGCLTCTSCGDSKCG